MKEENKPPTERLAVLDENGGRMFVIPAEVRGFFATRKKYVQIFLVLIFLLIPWIKLNGEQLILLDVSHRHFVLFGINFLSHDAPLLFFIIILFVLLLALMTTLFGRVWCGWACPQTVFIEIIYRKIEILTEGTYIERRRLHKEGKAFERIRKSGSKWVLYFLVSSLFAHSFVAYFTGSDALIEMMRGTPAQNLNYFYFVFAMTLLLLFNFGWFREQFCFIVCPYGKLQSALFDSHTLTVMYDEDRGEPRKGSQNIDPNKKGDCVSCQRCVQVCPSGIDIRKGIQMECIGCTACIDACDEIMVKVNKPKGLIRYKAMTKKPIKWFRARVMVYLVAIAVFFISFCFALVSHTTLRVEIIRGKDIPYIVRSENRESLKTLQNHFLQNHFKVTLENDSADDVFFKLEVPANVRMILPENPVRVEKNRKKEIPLFIEIPLEDFYNESRGNFTLRIATPIEIFERQLTILGPEKK